MNRSRRWLAGFACGGMIVGSGLHLASGASQAQSGRITRPAGISQQASKAVRAGAKSLWGGSPPSLRIEAPEPVVRGDGTPGVHVVFSGGESPVDPESFGLSLDGQPTSAVCSVSTSAATCTLDLIPIGTHWLEASVSDLGGGVGNMSLLFEQRFTVEHARAEVVSFEPSEMDSRTTLGLDGNGAVVWTSGVQGA